MITLALFIALHSPFGFTEDYLPLPNPKPADCIIIPLGNPEEKDIVEQRILTTA